MLTERHRSTLQTVLQLDAATCLVMAVLLILASGLIGELTSIPTPLLFWAGMILLPAAGFMASLSRTAYVPYWATLVVVGGNVLWVLASLLLPALGMITPNVFGWSFLVAQAVVVATFAWFEWAFARQPVAQS